ncbi:MAG: hypothetical protein J6B91_01290 [Prevotella sp.]|nr:hypothetical protein [Prevotella sp.]
MKPIKYITIAAMLVSLFAIGEVSAKKKMLPKGYMFGFSAAFTDSVVYFTDIQAVDSVWIDTKSKFLLGRDNYSYQLKDYFTQQKNMPSRTCVVFFGKEKKDVEKKLLKMRKKYTTKSKVPYDIRFLSADEFKFKGIDMNTEEE